MRPHSVSLISGAERKDAIIGFLSATERVEQHREQHASEFSLDEAPMIGADACRLAGQEDH